MWLTKSLNRLGQQLSTNSLNNTAELTKVDAESAMFRLLQDEKAALITVECRATLCLP